MNYVTTKIRKCRHLAFYLRSTMLLKGDEFIPEKFKYNKINMFIGKNVRKILF